MSSTKKKQNYKDTVLLPKTDFPMRANLVQREPERLAHWDSLGLYHRICEKRRADGCPRFILHDGPPFANGDAHMGTALNKVLKDLVLKSRSMLGFYTPYVPGWDCHGLPIEFKVVKAAQGLEPAEVRRRSEEYARKFIDIQRGSFKRLGVFADWENPYLTLDPAYEADIIRVFAKMVEDGLVYQSKKPVSWSYGAQTALAEAEVEFMDRTDPAVFVRFELEGDSLGRDVSMVIWTTTPWTLPANLGIAVNPLFEYLIDDFVHEDGRRERLVVAQALVESFGELSGFKPVGNNSDTVRGKALEGMVARHPFLDRESQVMTASFVTSETGTGAVHIAPGHGQDDYVLGRDHGLGVLSPVDDEGRLTEEAGVPSLVGKRVFDANPLVIDLLKEHNVLLGHYDYNHSYPHCWRSKTPIVFRAVEQFFVRVDAIRQRAVECIEEVEWLPHWGRNRIQGTVEARPDWCISRQRSWGVPVAVFFDENHEPMLDPNLVRKVADIVEEQGSNVWFEKSDSEWAEMLKLPPNCTRSRDTLDVWIDSGSSHVAVLDRHPELQAPADLYLEATDQHRGWFQSSLLLGVACRGTAPYKSVITHGFVVDSSTGEKLSKSGKPVDAKFFYDKYGADNVRLWAASVDYNNEVPFSVELFEQVVDTYRRLRNTIRILLANLNDFDADKHAVAAKDLPFLDRWILERLHTVTTRCVEAYGKFEFRRVFNELNQFVTNDLSSLYVDITKDRLYCDAADSLRRRASQTAMAQVADSLIRLLAPILAYTADEAWEHLGHSDPVHLEIFPAPDSGYAEQKASPIIDDLLAARAVLQREVEAARKSDNLARNDEADVTLTAPEKSAVHSLATDDPDALAEFFIVSKVKVTIGDELQAEVRKSTAHKCQRCWRYDETVAEESGVCRRCEGVLSS